MHQKPFVGETPHAPPGELTVLPKPNLGDGIPVTGKEHRGEGKGERKE